MLQGSNPDHRHRRDDHLPPPRGSGPPVLLLHGFPETHLMWRGVALLLARRFSVVCADLRGYGRSGCPPSAADHAPYAKRAMARDMAAVMQQLGHARFAVAGHDRGGRVAYRMALDHPDRIERWPCSTSSHRYRLGPSRRAARAQLLALAALAQPEPLPERLAGAAPDAVVDDALGGWGSPSSAFGADVRAAYVEALGDAAHVHAICEEYRAGGNA